MRLHLRLVCAYDGAAQKFRQSVDDWLDKRAATARKAGDKKTVDRVKVDRDRFEKTGEPPADCPLALLTPIRTAASNASR